MLSLLISDDPSRLISGSGKVKQKERERMWGTFFHSRNLGKTLLGDWLYKPEVSFFSKKISEGLVLVLAIL